VGQTIANAAKEVNVAANEFIKTPAGMITCAFIAWKVVGGSVKYIIHRIYVWAQCMFLAIAEYFFIDLARRKIGGCLGENHLDFKASQVVCYIIQTILMIVTLSVACAN
jgi:hypothetical protein